MNKIIRVFKYFIKGISLAWIEFRFIIPRKLWKSYFKHAMFKFKYGNQDHLFYDANNETEYNEWIKNKEVISNDITNSNKTVTVCVYSDNEFKNKELIEESLNNQLYRNFNVIYNNEINDTDSEYILFINSDDILSMYCLNEIVKSNADLIYFDEDKLHDNQRTSPSFKPGFSPDTLLSKNYIGNSFAIKTSLCDIESITNDSLYDLLLRVSEQKLDIKHISHVLVHKTSNDKVSNEKLVREALGRRNIKADVNSYHSGVNIEYKNENEKVSIIIPTRDGSEILKVCLDSVYEKSTYDNFEVIVVDNGSAEETTFKLFEEYRKRSNFKVLRIDSEFNYSMLNNEAVKVSDGEYILLLNNDTEVITPNWIENMLGYARQNHVGAVGAKLYFPDETIQHCGVILGLYLVAGHCFWNYDRNYVNDLTTYATNFSAVTAACLMVKKSKMMEVGGLNETSLKVGSNDVDLCIKLLNNGYYNVLNPSVELYHHESKSRGVDNKTIEKYNRCKDEIEYMLNNYSELITNDPFYNKNYSLMRAYSLDKFDGKKMRQENIDIFCC